MFEKKIKVGDRELTLSTKFRNVANMLQYQRNFKKAFEIYDELGYTKPDLDALVKVTNASLTYEEVASLLQTQNLDFISHFIYHMHDDGLSVLDVEDLLSKNLKVNELVELITSLVGLLMDAFIDREAVSTDDNGKKPESQQENDMTS